MKKSIVFLFALLPAAAMASSDLPIGVKELPDAAQQFIRAHFASSTVTLATVDREFMDTSYDVIFTDGTHIEFDSHGVWKDIECRGTFVPEGVLLPQIAAFLREHLPEARVRDIERDRHGYELNLDNRRELHFTSRGKFSHYDD
jgi:hypothetical protein